MLELKLCACAVAAAAAAFAACALWVALDNRASLSASCCFKPSICVCWLIICSRSSRIWRSVSDSTGAFFATGFFVVFGAAVELVCCAGITTELTTRTTVRIAFNCFVMEPLRDL